MDLTGFHFSFVLNFSYLFLLKSFIIIRINFFYHNLYKNTSDVLIFN